MGLGKCEFDGDHDECDCQKRQRARTLVHHTIVDALVRFLKDVGMVGVQAEYKYWDPARVGTDRIRHGGCRMLFALTPILKWNTSWMPEYFGTA